MLTTTYDLDLSPGGVPLIIPISQYDAASRILVFNLFSNEGILSLPSGLTAEVRGTKPDGTGFSYIALLSGTTVTVTVTEQMAAVAGRVKCEITLYKGTPATNMTPASSDYQQIATANFYLSVERAALDKDTLPSNSEIRQLVNIIDRSDAIIAAAAISDAAKERVIALEAATQAARQAAQASQEAAEASEEAAANSAAQAVAVLESAIGAVGAERDAALIEMQASKAAAISDIAAGKEGALEELDSAIDTAMENIAADYAEKKAELVDIKTRADEIAQASMDLHNATDTIAKQALEKAINAENEAMETTTYLDATGEKMDGLQAALDGKIDGAYVDDGYLILTINGEPSGERLGPFAGNGGGGGGGGGGSSGNNATLTVTNTSGWLSRTIAQGSSCRVSLRWSSVEDGLPTGNGSLRIIANGAQKSMLDITQGDIIVDIAPHLNQGANSVSLTVADVYGNSRTIRVTITVVVIAISSTFDASVPYTGSIIFPYTPTGAVRKTTHFVLDGVEIGTAETSVSGRQQSFTIVQQSHGAHTLRVYFDAVINGETVRSNELFYDVICLEPLDNTPVITSTFQQESIKQYGTLNIPYAVYNPASLFADVTITVNGETVASMAVPRTEQVFSQRCDSTGSLTVVIRCGTVSRSFLVEVDESDFHVEAETEALALYLSTYGRSNITADRAEWKSGSIEAQLTGFNFTSDGWQRDANGNTVLRVAGDARVTIPYAIFATDFRGTGKTIEIEFSTRNVMNYDATILSCLSAGRGLSMTAQSISLASEQSSISLQFKEDEHVRVSFVIEKMSENRLILPYINGIMSGAVQYPANDDFSQVEPVGISIGSNDCTIDIYGIRVYDNALTRGQILTNYIADSQSIDDMLELYLRNDIYDEYGNVVIEKLPSFLPYIVFSCAELPQYKGDKKVCSGRFVDPMNPSRNFTFTGAQIDVQGTSSQYYERKNYKVKFKQGFTFSNGTTVPTFQLTANCVPAATFCFKADVASSEGTNNVELVRLYCDACPYETPAQAENHLVRQGIDGFPIVAFWNSSDGTVFIGKYNFLLDKSSEGAFGFQDDDESWELKNNTSERVLWKSADFEGSDWLNDFEARFPDTDPPFTDPTQLREFAEWLVSTDTTAATEETLPEPVTYGSGDDAVTYTIDSADYRLAKFRAELGNYVEMDSCLFYYFGN